jgi:hypothetical protein
MFAKFYNRKLEKIGNEQHSNLNSSLWKFWRLINANLNNLTINSNGVLKKNTRS